MIEIAAAPAIRSCYGRGGTADYGAADGAVAGPMSGSVGAVSKPEAKSGGPSPAVLSRAGARTARQLTLTAIFMPAA